MHWSRILGACLLCGLAVLSENAEQTAGKDGTRGPGIDRGGEGEAGEDGRDGGRRYQQSPQAAEGLSIHAVMTFLIHRRKRGSRFRRTLSIGNNA